MPDRTRIPRSCVQHFTSERQHLEDEAKLKDLLKTRDNLASLANAKVRFGKLYDQVLDNLQDADTEQKRLALNALDIKVYASTERIEIQGIIPLELPDPGLLPLHKHRHDNVDVIIGTHRADDTRA